MATWIDSSPGAEAVPLDDRGFTLGDGVFDTALVLAGRVVAGDRHLGRLVGQAAAIGIAVSVAQYLPTLFMGAGRIATLTTEAVTLSSSSDRRVTGVYATLQAGLPFAAYGAAFLIPALLYRNRRGLQPGNTE